MNFTSLFQLCNLQQALYYKYAIIYCCFSCSYFAGSENDKEKGEYYGSTCNMQQDLRSVRIDSKEDIREALFTPDSKPAIGYGLSN